MRACGLHCWADSHQQETMQGRTLAESDALQAGDLLFWKGHVAMATSPEMMIHANAHHMATQLEGLDAALARIADPFLGHVRP